MQEKREQEKIRKVTLVEMRKTHFKTEDGRVVDLEQSSSQDFDAFISKYIRIIHVDRDNWGLMMRWRAVNFALQHGKDLQFCEPEQVENK